MTDKHKPSQQLYTDAYFERGHWGLKVRQTLVALVGWICVIVPIVITITAFWQLTIRRYLICGRIAKGSLKSNSLVFYCYLHS